MKLDLKDFQRYIEFAREGSIYPDANKKTSLEIGYLGLGLAGETGEAVDVCKKLIRLGSDITPIQHQELRDKLFYEMGDIMWHYARLCDLFEFDFSSILEANVDKLTKRMEEGTIKMRSKGL